MQPEGAVVTTKSGANDENEAQSGSSEAAAATAACLVDLEPQAALAEQEPVAIDTTTAGAGLSCAALMLAGRAVAPGKTFDALAHSDVRHDGTAPLAANDMLDSTSTGSEGDVVAVESEGPAAVGTTQHVHSTVPATSVTNLGPDVDVSVTSTAGSAPVNSASCHHVADALMPADGAQNDSGSWAGGLRDQGHAVRVIVEDGSGSTSEVIASGRVSENSGERVTFGESMTTATDQVDGGELGRAHYRAHHVSRDTCS